MKHDLTARQRDIVNAAIDLIGEQGIQGLTVKRLAQKVGVTEPALYRHFDSKQDVVIAVLGHFKDHYQKNSAASTEKTGIGLIEELFVHHFEMFSKRPSIAALLLSTEFFREDKKISKKILHILDNMEDTITNAVDSAKDEVRKDVSSREIALFVMGSMRLLVTRWWLSGLSFDIQVEGKSLWRSMKRIISSTK